MLSINYENETEDGDTFSLLESISDAAPRREDIVADKLSLEHPIQRLHELDPEAAHIIDMLGDGAFDRAIAKDLGRPQRTFTRQMQRYRAELRTIHGY